MWSNSVKGQLERCDQITDNGQLERCDPKRIKDK